jgi:amino acid adenylation domain-containing protein
MMRLETLLEASARKTPDAPAAFEVNGDSVNYKSLEKIAADIAALLTSAGVQAGDRVGMCVPKSIPALATVFGILKAKSAYVPVDYGSPVSRNVFIFNDCAVSAIVVDNSVADQLALELGGGWERIGFPGADEIPAQFSILKRAIHPGRHNNFDQDLAYILYTSGSTGLPKGVVHSHATALAFIDWCSAEFGPVAADRFSSHAPFHFDLSILDIYVPIKNGASVVLIDSETGKQPGTLAGVIERLQITIWYSTPSILRMLVEYGKLDERDCRSLRIVNFAGEVFPIKHLRALMACWPWPAYYNLYGPTETNVCTYYRLPASLPDESQTTLPIGQKCSDDETRVVDSDGQVVATGREGELVVAGGSVMLGYWNLPDRNAEAFLKMSGRDWYRTGDIVREDADGNLFYLGRSDRMVKRRGYRVELGEIEAALHRHPSIPEAAVIARTNGDGEIQVIAYIAWAEAPAPSIIKLKQFCAKNLPLYMSPDAFKVLPTLPKTSTDKVDYQKLKEMA